MTTYLPGLEPDFDVKQELRFIGGILDLRQFDKIFIPVSGVDRHNCYDLGCERLGCAGCIFSSDRELKIEMENNPHIFEALDKLEADSGFTMSNTGKRIRERIK